MPAKLIILKDITEVVNAEYAKSIEKVSEIMVASTSHDMRTPLNNIINMLRLMEENITDSVA
jgi:signal transduction histidine kinase